MLFKKTLQRLDLLALGRDLREQLFLVQFAPRDHVLQGQVRAVGRPGDLLGPIGFGQLDLAFHLLQLHAGLLDLPMLLGEVLQQRVQLEFDFLLLLFQRAQFRIGLGGGFRGRDLLHHPQLLAGQVRLSRRALSWF